MNNRYTNTKKRGIQTHYIEAQKEVKKSEDEKQDQLIRQLLDNQQQISERLALPYNPPVKEEDPTLLPNYLFDETQSLPPAKGASPSAFPGGFDKMFTPEQKQVFKKYKLILPSQFITADAKEFD